ncbi:hypothetical protein YQE_00062, partial [Dendroctonus ponderosae]
MVVAHQAKSLSPIGHQYAPDLSPIECRWDSALPIASQHRLDSYITMNGSTLKWMFALSGRINSVKFGDAFVDLGAEFCHGEENNIVFSMVENLKILQHSKNDGRVFISNGTQMKDDDAEKLIGFADSLFADETPAEGCENSISVGECLDIRYLIYRVS